MDTISVADAQTRDAGLFNEQCEMILRTLTVPGEDSSTCTRWWVADLLAEHAGAEAPVCGEEPEVVERYLAWLSDEQLRELDALETLTADTRAAVTRTASAGAGSGSGGPDSNSAGSSRGEAQGREAEAAAWFEHNERAMDVWAEVLQASMDHAQGIAREERGDPSYPYADWSDGPPVFVSQSDFVSVW